MTGTQDRDAKLARFVYSRSKVVWIVCSHKYDHSQLPQLIVYDASVGQSKDRLTTVL